MAFLLHHFALLWCFCGLQQISVVAKKIEDEAEFELLSPMLP